MCIEITLFKYNFFDILVGWNCKKMELLRINRCFNNPLHGCYKIVLLLWNNVSNDRKYLKIDLTGNFNW